MSHSLRSPRRLTKALAVVGLAFVVLIAGLAAYFGFKGVATTVSVHQRQRRLAPFYVPPSGWQTKTPGVLLRSAPVTGVPDGGVGWRILYVTQKADGAKTVSSGLVFAPGPNAPAAPVQGRMVVAWAHPTVGLGDSCAPSRSADVEKDVQGLGDFLSTGWVVAATDYAELGTRAPSNTWWAPPKRRTSSTPYVRRARSPGRGPAPPSRSGVTPRADSPRSGRPTTGPMPPSFT